MQNQKRNMNRQKEIIDICLTQFIENGLFNTSARDLAGALDMQPSGLYYYFKSKDEIVVACAEEAGIRLEDVLILPILNSLDDSEDFVGVTEEKMEEAVPVMKFFTQVCTTQEYRRDMQQVLEKMKKRHQEYADRFAERLNCEPEEVAPYLYACVAIVANYMTFGEEFYYRQPFRLIEDAIRTLKERKK